MKQALAQQMGLRLLQSLRSVLAGLPLCGLGAPTAQAHVILAQKGTLNIVDGGAFMVLSLPVSAFSGIDDDGDALLSPTELRLTMGLFRRASAERQVAHF